MDHYKIGRRTAIVGLEWHEAPDGALHQKKIARLPSRKKQPLRGAVLITDTENNRHVGVWRAEKRLPAEAVSLAASVVKASPDGVFVVELEPDVIWMMIASQGVVVPGTDITGPVETINRELRKHVDLFGDLFLNVSRSGLVTARLDDEAMPVRGIEEWLAHAQPLELEALVQEEHLVEIRPFADNTQGKKRLLLVASVVVAGVGVWVGLKDRAPPPPPPPPPVVKTDRLSPEEQARLDYLQALARAVEMRNLESNGWVPPRIAEVLQRHAVSTMGWGFEGVVCTPDQCTLSWVPYTTIRPVQGIETYLGLTAGAVTMEERGNNLTAVVPGTEVPARRPVGMDDLDKLPRMQQVRADWWDFAQVMQMRLPGLEFEMPRRAMRLGPAEIPPVAGGVPNIEEVTLHVSGNGMERLARFLLDLDATPVRVRTLTFAPNAEGNWGSDRWRAELSYVAKR